MLEKPFWIYRYIGSHNSLRLLPLSLVCFISKLPWMLPFCSTLELKSPNKYTSFLPVPLPRVLLGWSQNSSFSLGIISWPVRTNCDYFPSYKLIFKEIILTLIKFQVVVFLLSSLLIKIYTSAIVLAVLSTNSRNVSIFLSIPLRFLFLKSLIERILEFHNSTIHLVTDPLGLIYPAQSSI